MRSSFGDATGTVGMVLATAISSNAVKVSLVMICLRQAHVDEFRIHAFDVGQHEQLLDGGVVAHIAIDADVAVSPLLCRLPKQRDVEQVRLTGIGDRGLSGGDGRRNQVGLNGIGMDAVIEFGQGAIEVPGKREALILVLLEALELLDEIKFELNRNPGSEFEGDVFMCVSAAVTARLGYQPNGMSSSYPLPRS